MTLNNSNQINLRLIGRSAVELAAVTLLVFVTGWGGVLLAESMHRHPVAPSRDGNIYLRIVKSDRHGDITFEEGPGYVGWWHCHGKDWKIDWNVAPESARRYRVKVSVLSPEPVSGQHIEVAIGDQVLEAGIPNTGSAAKWKDLDLGQVSLEAGFYPLTVRPASTGLTNLDVQSVILRPVELDRP